MINQESVQKQITGASPMHIVVVADDSGSMETVGQDGKRAADHATMAIQDWVAELKLQTKGLKPWFKFTLMHFGSECGIDAEAAELNNIEVEEFQLDGTSGSTRMDLALMTVIDLLRRTPCKGTDCPPFVFLFTDGVPDAGYEQATLDAAAQLKSLSLPSGSPRLVTIGFGAMDAELLRQLATTPDFFKPIANSRDLVRMLPKMGTPTKRGGDGSGSVQAFEDQIAQFRPKGEVR